MKKLIEYLKQKECGFGLSSFTPTDSDKENIERLCNSLTFKEKFEAKDKYGWFFEKHGLTNLVKEPMMNHFELADLRESSNWSAKHPAAKPIYQLKKSFENKYWDDIPMDKVIEHFKVFTERKSKNEKTFLTNEQFISFVSIAFIIDGPKQKQKINFSYGEKGFVIKRFYEFFLLGTSKFNNVIKKEKYIQLVYDNFDNLGTLKSIEAFFKPDKTNNKW